MFTRIAAGLLLCALAVPSVAQQVYKCVTKAGTEYQSQPCASGEAAKTWTVDVAPRSASVIENEQRLDNIRQQNAAAIAPRPVRANPAYRNNNGGGARLHHISQYRDPNACEAAKAERARVYEAVGMRRSFELSRRMDDKVWAACK
ncbi:DUF4124 domain-containing protein [Stenotrophomonas maltophilia]|uniref:DUF4124 domain-containing protein n=1 Tax=Stenotrophomonas maltophilia TaxID=40324 RepID=UPI00117E6DAF|nr:DUF4124 domain-containing protein [Stenotrophomonas maltophilia]MCM2521698.1 DUF4124 domain-containing protein [Stenotrophomonas maltophilia]HDX0800497.1 DUF4124 domain-containing protein [Stenotrophomonas maltophilia]HDX0814508.1 DUF4124 domain-containing protein [Stenotrophomonas maltophilia]HDX0822827.1 DUF4124 domain-containing protein [Stenotrophomonas maltophilia]HDX0840740.1 DUF4124 domain-containing protein [Stenotrophomonas maltophilia]